MVCGTRVKVIRVLLFHFSLLPKIELCAGRLTTVIMQVSYALVL